jgi:hypothetical protein
MLHKHKTIKIKSIVKYFQFEMGGMVCYDSTSGRHMYDKYKVESQII